MAVVHLIDPSGNIVEVPAEEAAGAARVGYAPASPAQVEEFIKGDQAAKKYGTAGQQAKTFGEQAASALTFGLSTHLEKALGVPAEDISGRESENPVASGLGTAAGVIAPALLTLGSSAAASGAAGVARGAAELAAPSLLGRAGAAVTKGVSSMLPEATTTAGKILGKAAAVGAGEAVVGAGYGVGQVVHEAALGDPNEVAQSALSTIGLSALLGGGLGAFAGAGEAALPIVVGKATEALQGLVSKAKGSFEDVYPGLAEKLTGGAVKAEDVSALMANKMRLLEDPAQAAKAGEQLGGSLQNQYKATEDALRTANREIRPAETEALVAGSDQAAVKAEYLTRQDQLQAAIEKMRTEPELYPAMYPKKLEQIRSAMWRDYAADLSPADAFQQLNKSKQLLDDMAKFGRMAPPEHADAIAAIKGLRSEIKGSLENPDVWGEAGARQAAFNNAQYEYFTARKEFQRRFMEKVGTRTGAIDHQMKPLGVGQLEKRGGVLDDYVNSSRKLVGEIEKSFGSVPSRSFDRDAVSSLIDKSAELTATQRKNAAFEKMVKGMSAAAPDAGGAAGGLGALAGAPFAGHLIPGAGPVLAAYGAAKTIAGGIKRLADVPKTVAILARLEQSMQRMTGKIEAGAALLARGAEKVAGPARHEIVAGMAKTFGGDDEQTRAQFKRRVGRIDGLSGNPDAMLTSLQDQNKHLQDHAPQVSQALNVLTTSAVSFLASKRPATTKPGPLAPEIQPSVAEMAKFNRYYEAVSHPERLLKQAAHGTLTPEAVEAVRSVHPATFAKMQRALLGKMSIHPEKVPYSSRLMASMMFGADLDGTMAPHTAMANQAVFRGPGKSGAVPGTMGKPSVKGLGNLSLGNRMMTLGQASEHRHR